MLHQPRLNQVRTSAQVDWTTKYFRRGERLTNPKTRWRWQTILCDTIREYVIHLKYTSEYAHTYIYANDFSPLVYQFLTALVEIAWNYSCGRERGRERGRRDGCKYFVSVLYSFSVLKCALVYCVHQKDKKTWQFYVERTREIVIRFWLILWEILSWTSSPFYHSTIHGQEIIVYWCLLINISDGCKAFNGGI